MFLLWFLRSEVGSLTWHHSAWCFFNLLSLTCLLVYFSKNMLLNGSLGVGYVSTNIYVNFLCTWLSSNSIFLYLQYGKDYEFEAPVKLLDKMLHSLRQSPDEQLVVVSQVSYLCLSTFGSVYSGRLFYLIQCWLSSPQSAIIFQVLVSDINIWYEDIVNTQVSNCTLWPFTFIF